MTKYYTIKSKSLRYPKNILTFQHTIALHLPELLPQNTAQYRQQIEFTTKHCMFSLKAYLSPENFTQSQVAMVVTF